MDREKLRTRYLQDEWPRQVGNLASTLTRLSSRTGDAKYDSFVASLLHEGTLLIEWCAPNVPLYLAADLAAMQRELVWFCAEATMRIEYDPERDLVYLWFGQPGQKAASTVTVAPGMHADFDREEKLIGIEILDASEILGSKVQFEVELARPHSQAAVSVG